MTAVFKLRNHPGRITNIQAATLTTSDYGIAPTHGLFGSDEWWEQVADGRLATRTVCGTITGVYMAGHNDWP
jgi:hypothetical protein